MKVVGHVGLFMNAFPLLLSQLLRYGERTARGIAGSVGKACRYFWALMFGERRRVTSSKIIVVGRVTNGDVALFRLSDNIRSRRGI